MNLPHEINDYARELEDYIWRQRLPAEWFDEPDHIAVKAANTRHYEALLKQIRKGEPEVERIVETELDNRRIATAILAGQLAVGSEWEVEMIEVMEPRPEKAGKDKVGLDHMEFFIPDLKSAEVHLLNVGIIPERQSNPSHTFLSIEFGERELKLTDQGLASIIRQELQEGKTSVIYQKAA